MFCLSSNIQSDTVCVCFRAREIGPFFPWDGPKRGAVLPDISTRKPACTLLDYGVFPQTLAAARRGSRFRSASPEVPGLGPATSALGTTTTERPLQHPIDQSWLICKTEHCITPLLTHPNIVERLGVVELVLFFQVQS